MKRSRIALGRSARKMMNHLQRNKLNMERYWDMVSPQMQTVVLLPVSVETERT
jgi:hypothetical protein